MNDAISPSNYADDVEDQGSKNAPSGATGVTHNYEYDEIGNLVKDNNESINDIEWTVSGKIKKINRTTGSHNKPDLEFGYDASGQRIYKIVKFRTAGVLSNQKD